jgi:hypothetical protein
MCLRVRYKKKIWKQKFFASLNLMKKGARSGSNYQSTKYVLIKSTTECVPSSELGLSQSQPLSCQRVRPSPQNRGKGAHSPAVESQFRRLEKKLSTLWLRGTDPRIRIHIKMSRIPNTVAGGGKGYTMHIRTYCWCWKWVHPARPYSEKDIYNIEHRAGQAARLASWRNMTKQPKGKKLVLCQHFFTF